MGYLYGSSAIYHLNHPKRTAEEPLKNHTGLYRFFITVALLYSTSTTPKNRWRTSILDHANILQTMAKC